jgi:hypothetical protein
MGRLADKVADHLGAALHDDETVLAALAANGFSLSLTVGVAAAAGIFATFVFDGLPFVVPFVVGYVVVFAAVSLVVEWLLRRPGRLPGSMWVTLVATTKGLVVVRNRQWSTTPAAIRERVERSGITGVRVTPGRMLAAGRLVVEFAGDRSMKVHVGARVDPSAFSEALLGRAAGT